MFQCPEEAIEIYCNNSQLNFQKNLFNYILRLFRISKPDNMKKSKIKHKKSNSYSKNNTKEKDINIETHPDCDFLFVFHISLLKPFQFQDIRASSSPISTRTKI